MSDSSIARTIRFQKSGVTPPVFLAGSFTEPEWHPVEMQSTRADDGGYIFRSSIQIRPGQDHQYKFRIGHGNNWVLDEDSFIVTDSIGNQNNMIPAQGIPPVDASAKTSHVLPPLDTDNRSSTPIEEIARVAAEVADTAAAIGRDGTPGKFGSSSSEPLASESRGEGLKMPLFAHEGLGGAYEFADDRFDHHALDDSDSGRSRSSSRNFTFDELDLTDPTIEKFPSDRGSVLNTLRKIQSSSSQDYAVTDDLSKSPRACAKNLGTGIDDSGRQSNGSLNPVSPNSSRRRDGRASMSSFGRSKSPASLGCIDEEPKASSTGQEGGVVRD